MNSIQDFLTAIYQAAHSGSWMYALVVALMFAVWLARTYLSSRVPWLKTDAGGVATALALAFFGAVGTALAGGGPLSVAVLLASAKIAVAAMGGWSGLKKLLLPALSWVLAKLGIKDPIAVAEKAGADAVKANPAPGAGSVKDVP